MWGTWGEVGVIGNNEESNEGGWVKEEIEAVASSAQELKAGMEEFGRDVVNEAAAGLKSLFGMEDGRVPEDGDNAVEKMKDAFNSWISPFGAPLTSKINPPQVVHSRPAPTISSLSLQFRFPDSEKLLENFRCSLNQTYRCHHNPFTTEPIELRMLAWMSITERHICFKTEENGKELGFAFDISEMKSVSKRVREGKDIIKITMKKEGQFLELKEFENADTVEAALALLEHLSEKKYEDDGEKDEEGFDMIEQGEAEGGTKEEGETPVEAKEEQG